MSAGEPVRVSVVLSAWVQAEVLVPGELSVPVSPVWVREAELLAAVSAPARVRAKLPAVPRPER